MWTKPNFVDDWDTWIVCSIVVPPLMLFAISGLAAWAEAYGYSFEKRKNLILAILLGYVLLWACLPPSIIVFSTAFPYNNERITRVVLQERIMQRYNRRYRNAQTYSYVVKGKVYEGSYFNKADYMNRYDAGDTIDITYNVDDPAQSCLTYTQYYYFNTDKEKYWNRILNGEGRRSRKLGLPE